jgi:hypothetical protein
VADVRVVCITGDDFYVPDPREEKLNCLKHLCMCALRCLFQPLSCNRTKLQLLC